MNFLQNIRKSARLAWLLPVLMVVSMTCLTGCDDDDDDYDHNPPNGQGAMIVDNNTDDNISVYINGRRVNDTKDDEARAYDLEPGVYRVVLEQQGGDRQFRDDIDILIGRLTILDVEVAGGDIDDYDVQIWFD